MSDTIDQCQYARHGHSTVHAIIYLMQAIHEGIDSGNCTVRIFFADFTKGFDIIDHFILRDELRSFNIDQTLFFGYAPFLPTNTSCMRRLFSVVMETSQWWRPTRKKLGLTLFAVMINKLLRNWHFRTKYVDDTTALEIIPRNSISMLDVYI